MRSPTARWPRAEVPGKDEVRYCGDDLSGGEAVRAAAFVDVAHDGSVDVQVAVLEWVQPVGYPGRAIGGGHRRNYADRAVDSHKWS